MKTIIVYNYNAVLGANEIARIWYDVEDFEERYEDDNYCLYAKQNNKWQKVMWILNGWNYVVK